MVRSAHPCSGRQMMRWRWQTRARRDLLVVAWANGELAYLRAHRRADGNFEVLQAGVLQQDGQDRSALTGRLEALGLKGCRAHVMLRPGQYQWLQIAAPGVPPQELRAAARFQIRDLLDTHVDDVTIDILRVGDGQARGSEHLFVVAALNRVLQETMALAVAMRWTVPVIEVQETAQRNLQNALHGAAGQRQLAHAALVLADPSVALLTVSCNEELFYVRGIEMPRGFLTAHWGSADAVAPQSRIDPYALVEEYVPAYASDAMLESSAAPRMSEEVGPGRAAEPDSDEAQRFLVEVQRSLDVWERSWSSLPLATVRVYAGDRTDEFAQWLARGLGMRVETLDPLPMFSGFGADEPLPAACWPLLGMLLRGDERRF